MAGAGGVVWIFFLLPIISPFFLPLFGRLLDRLKEPLNSNQPNDRWQNTNSAKMIWLMSCEDTDIIQKLADFVYKCFSLRNIR